MYAIGCEQVTEFLKWDWQCNRRLLANPIRRSHKVTFINPPVSLLSFPSPPVILPRWQKSQVWVSIYWPSVNPVISSLSVRVVRRRFLKKTLMNTLLRKAVRVSIYSRLPITRTFKWNRKTFELIGSSKKIAGSKEKTVFTVQWTF